MKWNNDSQPRILKSTTEVIDAHSKAELSMQKSNIVINSPAVKIRYPKIFLKGFGNLSFDISYKN